MRIAILTNAFPPLARGGAGQIAKLQADWLAAHGHEVRLFTVEPFPTAESDVHQITTFKSRTTRRFSDLGKTNAILRLLFHFEDLAPNLWAVDAIREWRPDVLVTHNVTGCGWGTAHMIKESGVRWVHVLHDVQMFEPSGQRLYGERYYGLRKRWRDFWAGKRKKAFGQPDTVVSPTRWLLEQHRAYGLLKNPPAEILPNPIVAPTSASPTPPAVISTEASPTSGMEKSPLFNNDMHPPVAPGTVIYLGRLSVDKGVDLLLDVWSGLAQRPGRLVLVGDGPLRSRCESMSDEAVECVGSLEHDEAMAKLSQADALVLPSLVMENQPTVLLEAVSMNKPVIAADVGGVRESLDGYGKLFIPGDKKSLADALNDLPYLEVDAQTRAHLLERHDMDRVMGRLVEILETNPD